MTSYTPPLHGFSAGQLTGEIIDVTFDGMAFSSVFDIVLYVSFDLTEPPDTAQFYNRTGNKPYDYIAFDYVAFDCNPRINLGYNFTFDLVEPADRARFRIFSADFDDGDYDFVHVNAENRLVIMPPANDVAFVMRGGDGPVRVSDDNQDANVSSRNLRKELV